MPAAAAGLLLQLHAEHPPPAQLPPHPPPQLHPPPHPDPASWKRRATA
jgi:hypothetical protein